MNQRLPKFLAIKAELIADITAGRLRINEQLPAREELQERFGVAKETLNKALKELIRERYLVAKRNCGTFVCERKELLRLGMIGKFRDPNCGTLSNPLVFGMQEIKFYLPYSRQYKLDFIDEEDFRRSRKMAANYDALFWMVPDEADFPLLAAFPEKLIAINRYGENFNFISTDHFEAQREITRRWIARFGAAECVLYYLDVDDNPFICRVRREGFIRACEESGRFYRICPMTRDFPENVNRLMREIPASASLPQVIVSPSSQVTGAVLRLARLRKQNIGEDLFFSDFDSPNGVEITGCMFPSVTQDHASIARLAISAVTDPVPENKLLQQFVPFEITNFE